MILRKMKEKQDKFTSIAATTSRSALLASNKADEVFRVNPQFNEQPGKNNIKIKNL